MATQTVAETPESHPFFMPMEYRDMIANLCSQASALAACIGASAESVGDMPECTIPNAAWLLQDLIEKIRDVAIQRRPEGAQA